MKEKRLMEVEVCTCDFCGKELVNAEWTKCEVCGKHICGDCNKGRLFTYDNYYRINLCPECCAKLTLKDYAAEIIRKKR